MGNEFISIKEIARNILPELNANLVFPNLCYKDYSADYVAGKGDTVLAELPYKFNVNKFTTGGTITTQDIKQKAVPVTLDTLATVDVEWSSFEDAVNITDEKLQRVLRGIGISLAEQINKDGLKLVNDIPYYTGTAGTTPDGKDDIINARKQLNKAKVPYADRKAIWDVEAEANFLNIGEFTKVSEAGTPRALREGEIGRTFGIDNYTAQDVDIHTVGTAISGGATISVGTAGSVGDNSVDLKVGSSTGTLVKGDIVIIDGEPYAVAEDVTLSTTKATVKLTSALRVAVTTSSTVTYIGSSSVGEYTNNVVFHEGAFAFVTRPLVAPKDKESYTTSANGITLRVVKGYNQEYKKTILSVDVLYGYKTCIPELATRVLG